MSETPRRWPTVTQVGKMRRGPLLNLADRLGIENPNRYLLRELRPVVIAKLRKTP